MDEDSYADSKEIVELEHLNLLHSAIRRNGASRSRSQYSNDVDQ